MLPIFNVLTSLRIQVEKTQSGIKKKHELLVTFEPYGAREVYRYIIVRVKDSLRRNKHTRAASRPGRET